MSEVEKLSQPSESANLESRDESLDDALNALEGMLKNHHVVHSPGHPQHAVETAQEVPDPGTFKPEADSLPVLDQVVIPGIEQAPSPGADEDPALPLNSPIQENETDAGQDFPPGTLPAPPHDDLVARLVNEVDIIVETSVEDAMVDVKKELMARIKIHLDIVLPELMEELLRRCENPQE